MTRIRGKRTRDTVHGRDDVVVVAVEHRRHGKGEPTGRVLVELLHESPLRDIDMEGSRTRSRVRSVEL